MAVKLHSLANPARPASAGCDPRRVSLQRHCDSTNVAATWQHSGAPVVQGPRVFTSSSQGTEHPSAFVIDRHRASTNVPATWQHSRLSNDVAHGPSVCFKSTHACAAQHWMPANSTRLPRATLIAWGPRAVAATMARLGR
eukprot:scaffold3036_cov414-Prasinococcus_capsulatus_cf.AAC.16